MIRLHRRATGRLGSILDGIRAFRWFGYGWAVVALVVLSDAAHATLF